MTRSTDKRAEELRRASDPSTKQGFTIDKDHGPPPSYEQAADAAKSTTKDDSSRTKK